MTTLSFVQRFTAAVDDHSGWKVDKQGSVSRRYAERVLIKKWSDIILDVAYSADTSGKRLAIPSLKSSS